MAGARELRERRKSGVRRLLLASLIVLAGCYRYVPLETGAPALARGDPIRAHLDGASIDLEEITVRNIRSMDAELVELSGSELIVSALWLDSATPGIGYPGEGWTVELPRTSVLSIERRVFDVLRTAIVVGGAVLATYFGWDSLAGSSSGGDLGDGGGQIR